MFDENVITDFSARYTGTMVGVLGIQLLEAQAESLTAVMIIQPIALNSQGFLHGGISPFAAETLASFASLYPRRQTHQVAGVSVFSNHLQPSRLGERVEFVVRPHRCRGRLHVWSVEMVGPDGVTRSVSQVTVAVDPQRVDHPNKHEKSSSPGTDSRVS